MSDELPAVIVVIKGGVVVEAYGTTPVEVFVLDYDRHPSAPPVDELCNEIAATADEFTPLYTSEVRDAVIRHLDKFDIPQ
jgi:hypothetical protein